MDVVLVYLHCVTFYITYRKRVICHALRSESSELTFSLGWIHYRTLMSISRPEARQLVVNNKGFLP